MDVGARKNRGGGVKFNQKMDVLTVTLHLPLGGARHNPDP